LREDAEVAGEFAVPGADREALLLEAVPTVVSPSLTEEAPLLLAPPLRLAAAIAGVRCTAASCGFGATMVTVVFDLAVPLLLLPLRAARNSARVESRQGLKTATLSAGMERTKSRACDSGMECAQSSDRTEMKNTCPGSTSCSGGTKFG
jgi:hypothetical protein